MRSNRPATLGGTRPGREVAWSERSPLDLCLRARLVFERDAEADAVVQDRSVLNRQILAHDLGHAQLAHGLRGLLDRDSGGCLPGLSADADDLSDAVELSAMPTSG